MPIPNALLFGLFRGIVAVGFPAVATDADHNAVVELVASAVRSADGVVIELGATQWSIASLSRLQAVHGTDSFAEAICSFQRFSFCNPRKFGTPHS
jgi:hypothetical protein